jgi:hypothetical protein
MYPGSPHPDDPLTISSRHPLIPVTRSAAVVLATSLLAVVGGGVGPASPGPVLRLVEVSHDAGTNVYHLHSVADFSATPEAVFSVLSDYTQVTRISGLIVESGVLDEPAENGDLRVFTTVEGCLLLFCRSVDRVEQLRLTPFREIVAEVEPELSDVHFGRSRWELSPLPGGGTRVDFQTRMTPGFWVPPVIGPPVIKRRLAREGREAVEQIEVMALEWMAR